MKTKLWLVGWFTIVAAAMLAIGILVYEVDPYMHYHKPYTDKYYYTLDNQRSQNDGICRYFDYDALITGTSMTENFKSSELDEMFGVHSIKVPYSGGTYKEINECIARAKAYNPNLKLVVRGLDPGMFFDAPDRMRTDLGRYPAYLYDANPFNDVEYLFNKDVIRIAYTMIKADEAEGFKPGITSFDKYAWWQQLCNFGINTVLPEGICYSGAGEPVHLSDAERSVIKVQIAQNVTDLADEYPETEFYYFFTPYSVAYYKDLVEEGTIYRQIEAERAIIELILEHENIKLFSFSGIEELVTDINNYEDITHYGAWINSFILRCMHENKYRLTTDNYQAYLDAELDLLLNFDYNSLNGQVDWADDFYPEALLNAFIWQVEPVEVLNTYRDSIELSQAELMSGQHDGSEGVRCTGSLPYASAADAGTEEQILRDEFAGAKIKIQDIGKRHYLIFYGKKGTDNAEPAILIDDGEYRKTAEISVNFQDAEWQQYIVDLSEAEGDLTLYFCSESAGEGDDQASEFIYSDIVLY